MPLPSPPPSPFDRRAHPPGLTTSVWTCADGWRLRRLDWPGEGGRGRLLFLSGRADFGEKYLEAMAHWHGAGWAVTSFDWRGQGGSRTAGMVDAPLSALLDDLDAFVAAWAAEGDGPRAVVAHSMGGHLTLRLIVERGWRPQAAVLIAPMLGLNAGPLPHALAAVVARAAVLLGLGGRRVLEDPQGLRERFLSASAERIADAKWWKAANPDWAVGPPRWAWIADAFVSTAALARAPVPAGVPPMFFLLAGRERLVANPATRRFAERVGGEAVLLPTALHEILREADPVRLEALRLIDDFLDRTVPA